MDPYTFPELYCPFPSAINRDAALVEQATLNWAQRWGLVPNAKVMRRLEGVHVGRLIGRAYPLTTRPYLQFLADWTTWLFFQDDQCDEHRVGGQPSTLQAQHSRTLAVLRGAPVNLPEQPLTHALADLRQRLQVLAQGQDVERFVHAFAHSLDASVWEASNRAQHIVPDVAAYLRHRGFTGGLYSHIALIPITEQVDLPSFVLDHPVVQALTRTAVNVVCYANDLFSLPKEMEQGDVHNLILSLQHTHQIGIKTAIRRAVALHDGEVRAFQDLELRLPQFDRNRDYALSRYVAVLRTWMRGNLDWSLTSGRYPSAAALARCSTAAVAV